MALESGSYINDLVTTNPTGADPKSAGDDHLRLLKTVLKNCFPGFTGSILVTGTDGGSANAYTVTPAVALPAYSTRVIVIFSPTVQNTGASTINISGLGTKSIVSVSNAALVSGDLVVGTVYAAAYDGTSFRLLSITKNYVDQLAFSSALPAQPGGTPRYELTSVGGSAAWQLAGYLERRAITGASTITKDDAGDLVEITSGTFTLAFDPVATLTDKASGLIYNSGSGEVTLDPSGAETIDTLTSFVMYPGELRRWYVNGSGIRTLVLKRFYMSKTTSGNFVDPPGYTALDLDGVGASGGAGSGRRGAAATSRSGGAPGGAPARVVRRLYGRVPGTVTAYTVGAAGVGGAAVTVNSTNGNNGTAGGNTTFGSVFTAFGGAGGRGGDAGGGTAISSGSGSVSSGTSTNGGAAVGGEPSTPFAGSAQQVSSNFTNDNIGEGGGGVPNGVSGDGGCSEYGGAGSGFADITTTTQRSGGSSIYGVPAGGQGAWVTNTDTFPATGGAAGARGSYTAGGGAAGGTSGASPTAGAAGAAATSDNEVGGSGGGGGSSRTAAAGAGGDGGAPGGAPGGGGASENGFNSGAGGNGAAGRLIFIGVI